MRRLFLPPEGRAWWPEPLMLVAMAGFFMARTNVVVAGLLLVAAGVVAVEYRWPRH